MLGAVHHTHTAATDRRDDAIALAEDGSEEIIAILRALSVRRACVGCAAHIACHRLNIPG